MKIIVQKFGGTSVKDDQGEKALAHILSAKEKGYKSVVVVSAMGRKGDPYATDTLLGLLYGNAQHMTNREKDLLVSCGENISAVVFQVC